MSFKLPDYDMQRLRRFSNDITEDITIESGARLGQIVIIIFVLSVSIGIFTYLPQWLDKPLTINPSLPGSSKSPPPTASDNIKLTIQIFSLALNLLNWVPLTEIRKMTRRNKWRRRFVRECDEVISRSFSAQEERLEALERIEGDYETLRNLDVA